MPPVHSRVKHQDRLPTNAWLTALLAVQGLKLEQGSAARHQQEAENALQRVCLKPCHIETCVKK